MKRAMLRGRIIEMFGTYKNFADAVGESPSTVSATLRAKTVKLATAVKWGLALDIPKELIVTFFE